MGIPFKYSWRNLLVRRLTTALTVFGVMLVAFVFAAVLMLAHGLRQALVSSGSDDNVVIIRQGSGNEVQSFVTREQANIIRSLPEIAIGDNGQPLVAGELVLIVNRPRRGSGRMANVTFRGVGPQSVALRPKVKLLRGRMFEPGKPELVAGLRCAENFQGCGLGESFMFGNVQWQVVGVMEASGTAFESELWGDVDQLMPAAGRPVFSSMIFRLKDPRMLPALRQRLLADPRMTVDIKTEKAYYRDQTQWTTAFIQALGLTVSIIFSLGAIVGAMITMYGAVANRAREIAVLRALGFSRRSILWAFLLEAQIIAIIGGILGLAAAGFLQLVQVSTINWDTFSEISFRFRLSFGIAAAVIAFAIVMGILGGFLPALRATRIRIAAAQRAE